MNPYSAQDRLTALMAACVAGVASEFRWLPLRDIIDPPHRQFDAALARQVALHILIRHFGVPKRRAVELQERSREAVNRALRTVDERLETPAFVEAYRRMMLQAHTLYADQLTSAKNAA